MKSIKLHHVILNSKAEMDQLMSGLQALGLLAEMQHNPSVLQPLFVRSELSVLSTDKQTCSAYYSA